MKGYNPRNKLKRIIDIQELYQKHKVAEATHVGVWREHIYPLYKISLKSLENYLATPAKKELLKLDNEQKQINKNYGEQTTMDFAE